ncbi:MAG: hypothetical protein DRI30_08725 [Chloroflexi bacterium]|nr:MAG: hypothetical protein DRI30_08725 [Chloroflexota bacterium]
MQKAKLDANARLRKELSSEALARRDELQQEIKKLSASLSQFIKENVEAEGGADDSLDEKIYRAVREQAAEIGLTYDSDGY